MNALQVMDRYLKVVIQVSTLKNDIKIQHLYDNKGVLKSYLKYSLSCHFDIAGQSEIAFLKMTGRLLETQSRWKSSPLFGPCSSSGI